MGVIMRQTIKSSAVYYVSALFGIANRLFLIPEFLTPAQIGFLDNFTYLAVILASLSMLGSNGAISKFHQYFENKGVLKNFFGKTLLISTVGFIIFGTIFIFLKDTIISKYNEQDQNTIEHYYYFIPLLALFLTQRGFYNSFASIKKRIVVPAIFSNLWIKIASIVLYVLIGISLIDFDELVYLLLTAHFLALFFMITYCIKQLKMEISFEKKLSRNDNMKILKYGSFVLLSGFSGQITQYADSIMLSSYEGFETSGIYSIAFFIGMSIEMPKRALSTISLPIVASYFESNNLSEINKLYKQSSINQGIIAFLLFSLVFINLNLIFKLIPDGEIYAVGKNVALLIGISKVLDMFMGINAEILRVSKLYYLDLYFIAMFVIVTIVSNYLLIPIFNMNGAALATLISIVFYNIIRYAVLKIKFNFSPFSIESLKLLALFLIMLLLKYILPEYSGDSKIIQLLVLFLVSGIISISYIFACYKLKISKEFNKLINLGLNRIGVLKN